MLSEKFIKKYLRLAKLTGEDSNECHSRKIGTLIIDVENNKDVIGEYADELLREKEMQQPNPLEDMMGGNNNPAMPNLKKMLNNETII